MTGSSSRSNACSPGTGSPTCCAAQAIPFVLGHALDMKAIHGGKAKHDKIDSHKIALLLRGGMLPQAYVDPAEMRATRALVRRRTHLMRTRAELLVSCAQYQLAIQPARDRQEPRLDSQPGGGRGALSRPGGAQDHRGRPGAHHR